MTTYGGEAHELGSYWLGKPVAEPGTLFYAATLALRMTPVTSIGLLLAVAAGLLECRAARPDGAKGSGNRDRHPGTALALLAFVLWFGILLTLGAKKIDRYLLPIFPAVDLLAAWGWMYTLRWVAARWGPGRTGSAGPAIAGTLTRPPAGSAGPAIAGTLTRSLAMLPWAGAVLLVAIQAWGALVERPSYLTAYNPLAGGIRAAARIVPVGWGEGLEKAAAYLNGLPGAETSHVAAWYGANVFGAFYRGTSFDLYYDAPRAVDLYARDVDWVVTYINQEQRGLVDSSVAARLGAPVYTVARDGVNLASVYAWPKPFAHTSDRRIDEGLRLLGWQVGDHNRREGVLPVTLYWDAAELAASPGQRLVIWMKDAAGEVWASAEEEVEPASQTGATAPHTDVSPDREPSQWEVSAAVQSLTLHPPIGLSPGVYRIELAPFAGNATELAVLEVEATRLAEVASLGPQVTMPAEEVRFGEVARLVGSEVESTNEFWTVDLVWAWLASPEEPHHYFIHVMDQAEKIIAQQDGPLAQAGAPGELARQRAHLAMPQDMPAAYRVYVGIYRPGDGARVPLTVNSQPVPDSRYPLATRP